MDQQEFERMSLVYEVARAFDAYKIPGGCGAAKTFICQLAWGRPITMTPRYPAIQYLRKSNPNLWKRLLPYFAEGTVKA